ncbi:hypothetical protein BDR04DRAFT_1166016 [Suillus decipiens]|nr:hypothetical protein BDR04DRAFT_1166016 [Suillus decipiens]
MSDIPPLQSMLPPSSSPSYPELRYNDAGNAFVRNEVGAWVPHPGICKFSTLLCIEHREPKLSVSSYQSPGTYALSTPANFKSKEDATPPLVSGSHIALCQVVPNHMIDPALLPLPDSGDLDLTDAVTIAKAYGHALVAKTAGSCCQAKGLKGKGKDKENVASANSKKHSQEDADADDEVHAQRGHPQGSNNYMTSDIKTLLDMAVHVKFCQWAKVNRQPERKVSLLETKFKQLVKTTKPMGDSVCPPEVTHALHIDQLINERTGTHDLDDMDFDGIEDDNNHSIVSDLIQDESDRTSPPIQFTAVACSTTCTEALVPHHNVQGAAATELLTHLSSALDPAAQQNCDEDRANRSLATVQLLTQGQQLCDSQASVETLQGQLFDLRSHLYDVECECDWAELCMEMIEMTGSTCCQHIQMPKCKNLHQEWSPDGGGSVRWITDEGKSTASEVQKPKPPHLQRCGPSRHLKHSDRPYFEDSSDEPYQGVKREVS